MTGRRTDGIVADLVALADTQDLIGRAIGAGFLYLDGVSQDDADWALALEELRFQLGAQMLCFRSGATNLTATYVATNVRLHAFEWEVGWYERLTTLAGEFNWEDGAIFRDYGAKGRAAALIVRARNPVKSCGREWVGVVELRPIPGGEFFPDCALGGFATALALAEDQVDYRRRVSSYFADRAVDVVDVDAIELFAERLRKNPLTDDEVLRLGAILSNSSPVAFTSTIHAYSGEGTSAAEG